MNNVANTEAQFAALYLLLSQTKVNGQPFTSTSRRLPQRSNVTSGQQPALFMCEAEEDVTEREIGLPVEELRCGVVTMFRVPIETSAVPSMTVNAFRDAVVNQIRNFTLSPGGVLPVVPKPPSERQTLGRTVYHCRISGKIVKNEGLIDGQGAVLFPVSILTGL